MFIFNILKLLKFFNPLISDNFWLERLRFSILLKLGLSYNKKKYFKIIKNWLNFIFQVDLK